MARDDDEDEKATAGDQFRRGVGLLFKAARNAAKDLKKTAEKQPLTRGIEDAGRELVRAATNVATRVESELRKAAGVPEAGEKGKSGKPGEAAEHAPRAPSENEPGDASEPGQGAGGANGKPKGPTVDEPGFRIADEPNKPKGGSSEGSR